jgi:hypothetical protein
MPADQRCWFHNDQCAAPREVASEPREYETIGKRRRAGLLLAFLE